MKVSTSCVVLGDVVGSRRSTDRRGLHQRLSSVLEAANLRFGSDLRVTVGDEYQGHFASLGAALVATWWIRVHLRPDIDVRHGLGLGETAVLDPIAHIEDGPGWWAARRAIESVETAATRPRTRHARDLLEAGDGSAGADPLVQAVNAALAGRDELTGRLDERALRLLRALSAGESQADMARAEGISASAVSQRLRQDGLGMLMELNARLEVMA